MSRASSPLLEKHNITGPELMPRPPPEIEMIEMRDCMSIDHVGHCHCAPTPKGRRWLGACLVPAFVIVAVAAAVALAEIEHDGRSHHASSSGSTSDGWSDAEAVNGCELAAGTYYCSYGSEEFLRFAKVRNFLEGRGANISDADELKTWLPTLVTVEYTPGYVEQAIGSQMLDAYVAFSLYLPKQSHVSSGARAETVSVNGSYMVVLHTNGSLKSVAPTADLDEDHTSGGTHMSAFKFMSPSEVLTSSAFIKRYIPRPIPTVNCHAYFAPNRYTWAWGLESETDETPRLERLVSKRRWSAHDVQMARGGESYWQPTDPAALTSNYTFSEIDRTTGVKLDTYLLPGCDDMNHVQVLEDERVAIVSCRLANSVVKYDLATRSVVWIAGGAAGNLTLIDEDGGVHPPGTNLWSGQHNAEYFGDDQYFLFDNQYGQMTPSRLLVFDVDERAGTATVTYAYTFFDSWPHGYSEVFGDNDQLPTGNMLTCWWPNALSPAKSLQYDVQLLEVTHAEEIAWKLNVFGRHECLADSDDLCDRNIQVGWKVYSLEKLYARPPLYNGTLLNGTLAFTTHTQFKTSAKTTGAWRLALAGDTLAAAPFDWEAHFRATTVTTLVDADVPDGATLGLYVTNEFETEAYLPIVVGQAWTP